MAVMINGTNVGFDITLAIDGSASQHFSPTRSQLSAEMDYWISSPTMQSCPPIELCGRPSVIGFPVFWNPKTKDRCLLDVVGICFLMFDLPCNTVAHCSPKVLQNTRPSFEQYDVLVSSLADSPLTGLFSFTVHARVGVAPYSNRAVGPSTSRYLSNMT
jgi:hypothetical protein